MPESILEGWGRRIPEFATCFQKRPTPYPGLLSTVDEHRESARHDFARRLTVQLPFGGRCDDLRSPDSWCTHGAGVTGPRPVDLNGQVRALDVYADWHATAAFPRR